MFWSFFNSKICLAVFVTLIVGAISVLTNSCTKKSRNVTLECVSNHILENVEKEKIKEFIKLEGVIIWREGWTNMTTGIAKDHFAIEKCGIRQYLNYYNLSLDDLKGQMVFVYSMHSYLKHGYVNQDSIIQMVDSLFFKE